MTRSSPAKPERPLELASDARVAPAQFLWLLVLILGAIVCLSVIVGAAINMGGNIPTEFLERDYLIGLLWGVALTASIFWWPASREERYALLVLWVVRLFVTLVAMLLYEQQYGSLDSYTYFVESREIVLTGYVPDEAFGTQSVPYAFSPLWYLLPPSYHALKVTCAYMALAATYVFFKSWRIASGDTSLGPLWVIGITPSILFWSSTVGKEPLIFMSIAVATWGTLILWRDAKARGALALVAGLVGMFFIRPWMPVLFGLAVATAFVIRPTHRLIRVFALVIGITVFGAAWYFTTDIIGISEQGRLLSALELVSSSWAVGGSANEAVAFTSISDIIFFVPLGVFTALFRPLPGEIGGAFGLVAGVENTVLLIVLIWTLAQLIRSDWRFPVVFAFAFVVWWTGLYSFLSYQNLGTAVRFKMQIMPFLVALIGFAVAQRRTARSVAARAA